MFLDISGFHTKTLNEAGKERNFVMCSHISTELARGRFSLAALMSVCLSVPEVVIVNYAPTITSIFILSLLSEDQVQL